MSPGTPAASSARVPPGVAPGRITLGAAPGKGSLGASASGGGGAPLDAPVRSSMEGLFGADFRDVRVHHDGAASSVGAEAFARGNDVHFAPGRYAPDSRGGRELLGHELAHVLQQRSGRAAVPQARGDGILQDAALEAEADDAGARVARGERVSLPGSGAGVRGGLGVAQCKISLGQGKKAEVHDLVAIRKMLQEAGYNLSPTQETVLAEIDAGNEAFADLAALALALKTRTPSASPRLSDDKTSKQALGELETGAPASTDTTASWRSYWTALCADLENISGEGKIDNYDALLQGITAVLLYKIHIASFRSVDPDTTDPKKPQPLRQQSPQDLEDANVYYRSQDKGHPIISLYKDLVKLKEGKKVNLAHLLAPYNTTARKIIDDATEAETPAKNGINVEQNGEYTSRDQKEYPKKQTKKQIDAKAPVEYQKKKHTESLAGYAGLRRNNADAIEMAVHQLCSSAKLFGSLIDYVKKQVKKFGGAPKAAPSIAVDDGHLDALLDIVVDLNAALGVLSQGPQSAETTGEEQKTGEAQPVAIEDLEDEERRQRAFLDPSYVVRKLGQASERADWVCNNLPKLKRLIVARDGGNPQITVQVRKTDAGISDGEHATFVNALRVYFGALVARRTAEVDVPLAVEQRQSFGFLDSSVTDTGEAMRISIGTEPMEMVQALRLAIIDLDDELEQNLAKKSSAERQSFSGKSGGSTKPLATFEKCADSKYIGYFNAIAKQQDLAAFLSGAPDVSKTLDTVPVKDRVDHLDKLSQKASQVLATSKGKGKASASTATKPLPGLALYDYELTIVEPLLDILAILGDMLQLFHGKDLGVTDLPTVQVTALGDLAQQLSIGLGVVDTFAALVSSSTPSSGDRARTHLALRNVTENLMAALVVFVATTQYASKAMPEARVEDMVASYYGIDDVSAIRADSGEQSGTTAISALRAESKEAEQPFLLEVETDKSYFEYKDFLEKNKIEHTKKSDEKAEPNAKRAKKESTPTKGTPTATLIDPSPFVTTLETAFDGVEVMSKKMKALAEQLRKNAKSLSGTSKGGTSKSKKPRPPYTILLDCTNIDFWSPKVCAAVDALIDLVKAGQLRIVLFNSCVKHEESGHDIFQVGRTLVLGPPIPGLDDLTRNTLIGQVMAMLEGLRESDALPASRLLPGGLVEALASSASSYTALIASYGKPEAWGKIVEQCRAAQRKQSGAELSDEEISTLHTLDSAAGEAFSMVSAALQALAKDFLRPPVKQTAHDVFNSLPTSDQDVIRGLLAPPSKGGSKGSSDPAERLQQPLGESTMTGVINVGNTCYLSAGLTILAFCDPYYQLFAPRHGETGAKQTLRAHVRTILDLIRGGTLVDAGAITKLLRMLDENGLLPPPSVEDRQRGVTAVTAQHDLSEVIFRKLIDFLGSDPGLALTHAYATDFTGSATTEVPGADPNKYSALPSNGVMVEAQQDMLLEVSIDECPDWASVLARMKVPAPVDGVRTVVGGKVHSGKAQRSEQIGTETPNAITIVLKRFQGLAKDTHQVAMPDTFQLNGATYQLQVSVLHSGATVSSGHYTASVRNPDGQHSYRNDETVTPESKEHHQAVASQGLVYAYVKQTAPQQGIASTQGTQDVPVRSGSKPPPTFTLPRFGFDPQTSKGGSNTSDPPVTETPTMEMTDAVPSSTKSVPMDFEKWQQQTYGNRNPPPVKPATVAPKRKELDAVISFGEEIPMQESDNESESGSENEDGSSSDSD